MSKLLATTQSIEALAYARELILRVHRKDGGSDSLFEAPAGRAFLRDILHMFLLTSDGRLHLTELALAGETDAQDLLRKTIAEARSWRRPLPVELEYFELLLLQGEPLAGPPRGPQPKDDLMRNFAICCTVAAVCDRYGIKAMHSSVRKRSGCAIVAEALGVIDKTMSYDAVRRIWKRYGRALPPGWMLSMMG
jgi:hypothetical protein